MGSVSDGILEHFLKNRDTVISGETLAEKFHLSRTAVWMHIERLRKIGFVFEAVPRLGYRLTKEPDMLIPELIQDGLDTKILGKQIYAYDCLDSTSTKAMQLALDGAVDGTVVIAQEQAKGRGRMGRSWYSKGEGSLTFSIVLKPDIAPSYLPLLTIVGALGIAKYLERDGFDVSIKWPNDVLIQGKKVAGILTEAHTEQDSIAYAILGVGINVNLEQHDFPESLREKITSLGIVKKGKISRLGLLKNILVEIEKYYIFLKDLQTSFILEEWSSYSALTGRWVKILTEGGKHQASGIVIGMDPCGAMLLRTQSGEVETIMCGDVHVIGA